MFRFKEFCVCQDKTPMKIGTDGVLLGAWVDVYCQDKYFLDIGTGTGLIALMLAQRASEDTHIDAIEIDHDSANQAHENFMGSKWSQQVDIHNINIISFKTNFRYDLIVSNPPYFVDSLLPPSAGRASARHTIDLTFSQLLCSVERLIAPNGRFALILPVAESELFEKESNDKLYLTKRCNIKSRRNGVIKRVMSEYMLTKPDRIIYDELSIRECDSNDYSQEYRSLTSDFYLKF